MLLTIDEADWEQSFTPWPAPKVFKKGADFGGGAGTYFARLCAMLPAIESSLNLQPEWRGIAGYSLAGLFAAWSAYQSGQPFSRTACVSGSMWYDGWLEFAAHAMPSPPQYAYFSLGDEEKTAKTRAWRRWKTICAPPKRCGASAASTARLKPTAAAISTRCPSALPPPSPGWRRQPESPFAPAKPHLPPIRYNHRFQAA